LPQEEMEEKSLFESKHSLSLKCVLFLFYGGLGCIYPFLQSNMAQKGFAYNEIYSISIIIPLAALLGPFVFALLVDKWAIGNAFAYGKRLRILTAITLIASMVLYVLLMFAVSRTPPPEICAPQASFLCNRKGAFIVQEKCSDNGICHDWAADKTGLLNLENCTYTCQKDNQFESTCYARHAKSAQMAAWLKEQEDSQDDDEGAVLDLGSGQGVADFGRQLVWGAVGWIIFFNDDYEQPYMLFVLLYTTAAVILLSPLKMDLSPPEEWWQLRTVPQKFLSVPACRNVIDSIDESHMTNLPTDGEDGDDSKQQSTVFQTLVRTLLLAGDLLAIPVLIYSRRIIEVFGTCKILVGAFLSLVLRFILLAILDYALWDVVEDWLLPTTLGLTWVTLVLHFRELLPRKVSALAQALPVVAHFGFGRFFGALIGIEQHYHRLENDYEIIAGVLFGLTIISVVLYRYREIVLNYLGQYIPALKPGESNGAATKAKGETNV
uniref:Major facilitator superfamily associated domain-containing protein n=1 Tax=Anopheles coluzzii TaxID=1518534 RepID=A0A8W7PHK7_ANOCL